MPRPRHLVLFAAVALVAVAVIVAAGFASLVLYRPHEGQPPVTAPSASVAALASPPAPPDPQSDSRSFATFRAEQLDECVDWAYYAPADAGAGAAQALLDKNLGAVSRHDRNETTLRIQRPCGEQFADRVVLATCILRTTVKGMAGWRQEMESNYYRAATSRDDDTFMRQCLEIGGDWHAADPNDAEVRAEIASQKLRAAQKALRGL